MVEFAWAEAELLELKFSMAMGLASAYDVGEEIMGHFYIRAFKSQCAIHPVASLQHHCK